MRGVVDTAATDADPLNVERLAAMNAKAPPAGVLLMGVLAELLRPPRLPDRALRVGERVELEEESETVVVSAGVELVLVRCWCRAGAGTGLIRSWRRAVLAPCRAGAEGCRAGAGAGAGAGAVLTRSRRWCGAD